LISLLDPYQSANIILNGQGDHYIPALASECLRVNHPIIPDYGGIQLMYNAGFDQLTDLKDI